MQKKKEEKKVLVGLTEKRRKTKQNKISLESLSYNVCNQQS